VDFFPTETRVLDRHAEQDIFIILIVCRKGILMKHYRVYVLGAGLCKLWKVLSDSSDKVGLALHAFFVDAHADPIIFVFLVADFRSTSPEILCSAACSGEPEGRSVMVGQCLSLHLRLHALLRLAQFRARPSDQQPKRVSPELIAKLCSLRRRHFLEQALDRVRRPAGALARSTVPML